MKGNIHVLPSLCYHYSMSEYIIPLSALLLTFLSSLSCLRFIFSRQGFYWIVAFALSILLTLNNFFILLYPRYTFFAYPEQVAFFPILLAAFWYLMVITFHYALKRGIGRNRVSNDQKKNYAEAQFLEKIERREFIKFTRRRKEIEENGAYVPVLNNVSDSALDRFDS